MPEQSLEEQTMRVKLAELLEAMDAAAQVGVDVQQIMGEIVRHMMAQAEAAGVEVSPLAKMLFS